MVSAQSDRAHDWIHRSRGPNRGKQGKRYWCMHIQGHIVLTASDVEISKQWYRQTLSILSIKIVYEDEEKVYYEISGFPLFLAIFQAREQKGGQVDRYRKGLHHLAIRRQTREEIDAAFAHFQIYQARAIEPPQLYPEYDNEIYYAVFIHDPDGHRLELFYEKS